LYIENYVERLGFGAGLGGPGEVRAGARH
jgi:hypothetical protein